MQPHLLLVAGLLVAFSLSGCGSKTESAAPAPAPPVPVVARPVQSLAQSRTVAVSGALEADKTVEVGFLIGGRVSQVSVEEGGRVRAGQVLASLDVGSYRYALGAANATLARAQDEYGRLKLMFDRGSLTASDLEAAATAVAQARAQQQQAAKNVRDGQVLAPISGRLARRGTDPGEIVGPGTPQFTIVSEGPILMRAAVPEAEVSELRPGLRTRVTVPALDSTFTGTIEAVGTVADPASRTYAVKITLPNPGGRLRPGMVAEAAIATTQKVQVLSVPGEAIVRDADQLTYVYVADAQRRQAYRQRVQVGGVTDQGVQLTAGVRAGQLVVVGGQQRLRDGASIHLTSPAQ
ncbi:efflux RND transporter periplasmic adaptor subunit [Hymenobacter aquaticus]|uniref:Efflux RND transporter periplasmic adaptor subunit n=1 Tax=Hymenobacter aquaticus TaxID=1867101 RepID=A0A4Z0Q2E7_9BACT|nr:efflux RND transporter periplasmic adaptor subunit [Hymenobacter aquaticus]TGE23659.1 efflux RND transporter periplasmic adaptor subunit [Hymenobacter aquaticus]